MLSKIVILCLAVSIVAAVPAFPSAGAWGPPAGAIPPWVASAPWFPGNWAACPAIGSDCLDCNTKVVCTKVGGFEKPCTDPTMPYCNLGQCSATPTAECAPATPTA